MGLCCCGSFILLQLFKKLSLQISKKSEIKAAISSNCPAFNLSECDAHIQTCWPGLVVNTFGRATRDYLFTAHLSGLLSQNWQPTDSYGSSDPCQSTTRRRRRGQSSTKRTKTAKHEPSGDTAWQNKQKTIQEILARTRYRIQARMRQTWDTHVQSCTRLRRERWTTRRQMWEREMWKETESGIECEINRLGWRIYTVDRYLNYQPTDTKQKRDMSERDEQTEERHEIEMWTATESWIECDSAASRDKQTGLLLLSDLSCRVG